MIVSCLRRAVSRILVFRHSGRDRATGRGRLRRVVSRSLVALGLLLSGCGGADPVVAPPSPDAITAVTVSPATSTLALGATAALTPTPTTGGSGVTVAYSYTTSAPAVATVSGNGLVTAVAPGMATITVLATGIGSGFSTSTRQATATVIVPPAAITALTVAPNSVALFTGGTATLTPTPTIGGAGVTVEYAYVSSAPAVATVSSSGEIVAVSPGDATIAVTASASGTGFTTGEQQVAVPVTVAPPPPALNGLTVSPNDVDLEVGQEAVLTPMPVKADATVTVQYAFVSSDPAIAKVNAAGLITGVSPGTATVAVSATGSGIGFATTMLESAATVTVTAASPVLGIGFGDEQFATIPAGDFVMGTAGGPIGETPPRTVTLSSAFRMQKTEVTQSQWRQVMQGTGLENPSNNATCGETCPVERVAWTEVQTFLQRLNQQDPGKGYRLPTEAEWEYAARAGTSGDYGGSGVLNEMGWWSGNSSGSTQPVALKLANAFGLLDMHGNVLEWVNDWMSFSYYASAPNVDPPGPATGQFRVLRGGSWENSADVARSAYRNFGTPTMRLNSSGFRLVRNP